MPWAVSSWTYSFTGSVTYGDPAGGAAWATVAAAASAIAVERITWVVCMAAPQLAVTTETALGVATPAAAAGAAVELAVPEPLPQAESSPAAVIARIKKRSVLFIPVFLDRICPSAAPYPLRPTSDPGSAAAPAISRAPRLENSNGFPDRFAAV
jgi:hypothetical protein